MKALSIRQPWAWAIMAGHKPLENRSWDTKERGMFLVHAAQRIDKEGIEFLKAQGVDVPANLPTGCLLGTVELVDTVTAHPSPYFFGPVGFVLQEPRPFAEPVPYKGRLGFFSVPNAAWRQA